MAEIGGLVSLTSLSPVLVPEMYEFVDDFERPRLRLARLVLMNLIMLPRRADPGMPAAGCTSTPRRFEPGRPEVGPDHRALASQTAACGGLHRRWPPTAAFEGGELDLPTQTGRRRAVYLEAVARGLGACAVGAFYDDEAVALAGEEPAREWGVHFAALGPKE
jgi:nitroreductase